MLVKKEDFDLFLPKPIIQTTYKMILQFKSNTKNQNRFQKINKLEVYFSILKFIFGP